jgi:large subunit ribosomal protein L4
MASLTLKNASGKDAGSVDLDDAIFGIEPNVPLMHQVVTAQLAARRAGTQSAKTRAEVRGGGRKPYAQKGTGNARQGSIRSPQFAGGGVALAPKPRKYNQKTPKKMIKAALRSALSDRATEGKIIVVDSYGIDTPRTKDAKALLAALDISGTVLVVVGRDDANAALSFRNLTHVQVISPGELNTYDVLCNDWLVFSKDVVPANDAPSAASKVEKAVETAVVEAEVAASGDSDSDGEANAVDATPFGAGSHGPVDGDEMPEGFSIKGNADSMLYHLPDTSFYNRTVAEVWFATEDAAKAAGFTRPASQLKAEEAKTEEEEA